MKSKNSVSSKCTPKAAKDSQSPLTLFEMAGVKAVPAKLSESVVIVIDAQEEYVTGALPLCGVSEALEEARQLLIRARSVRVPVIHVVHRGDNNLFNPDGQYYAISDLVSPQKGEMVIEKLLPNSFAGTELGNVLAKIGRRNLIVVGFMTHMCVSATVRSALDHGYISTVIGSATATRDLPDGYGRTVPAEEIKRSSLAALADRFAVVVNSIDEIRD